MRIWGAIVFGISIIVYLYGVFHAHDVEITRFSVKLQNLPDLWKGKHVVFMSDLHLGNVRGKKFAGKISSLIQTLKPETVLIGGDLYDGVAADLDDLISPLRDVLVARGIYFITGNHEEFSDKTKYIEAVRRAGIRVLYNEKVELDGLELVGVDYMDATNRKRFEGILNNLGIDKTRPSILLKHEPTKLDIAERAGISFALSGHTHQGQMFPINLISRLIYGKHYHGFGKSGDMTIYTSSGAGTWGPPTRFGTNRKSW